MEKLTEKQEEVLEFIKKYKSKKGYPPTIREICKSLNKKSPATIHTHLNNLVKKGYIKKDSFKNRSIELLVKNNYENKSRNIIDIPLLGKEKIKNPIEAIEIPNQYFSIPSYLIQKNKDAFALVIKDDSMINVGIKTNDIAVIQVQKTAKDGDIIVAMTEKKEITIKTFYRDSNGVRLQPENDNMDPIVVRKIHILGKIIGLYRKF